MVFTHYNTQQKHTTASHGYSFIEVLVSIAILLVAIVGPMTIASNGLQQAQLARERSVATFLAQEGLEGVYWYQGQAGLEVLANTTYSTWDWVDSSGNIYNCTETRDPCRLEFDDGRPVYERCSDDDCRVYFSQANQPRYYQSSSDTADDATAYTREVYFDSNGSGELRVRSVVRWDSPHAAHEQEVALTTYLYDIYDEQN